MKEPTNPFTLRSSESIESQLTFLKLFGSGILDVLPDDCFLNKVTIFRSGPGGGKTSLFRLFRPESLREIFMRGSDYRDLSQSLMKYQVIDDTGPRLLGVYLRLSDYAPFQDLNLEQKGKDHYLFSLIGVRLIIKALTGILALKNLDLNHLDRIKIRKPQDHHIIGSPLPCNGKELYSWASEMEQNICGMINRFDVTNQSSVNPSTNIDHIFAITPDNLLFDDKPVVTKVLVLLDDLHELTKLQRKTLLDKVTPARFPVSIWIAERLEALELDELIPGIVGREYNTVYLEGEWETKGKAFETFVKSISTKRAQFAKLDFEMNSLHQHVEENIDTPEWNSYFQNISNEIKKRLYSVSHRTSAYDQWINDQEIQIESPYDNAINWRKLEIKIAREEKNAQKKLFDIPLETNLDEEPDSGIKATAEFFIHDEFKIPYFFGFSKISKLATYNVEQFLEIAAELFDEIVSQQIKNKKNDILNAKRQEEIIKSIAKNHLERIPKTNKNGRDIVKFLSAFKQFARDQTVQPNAPYVPGVTGIGISKKLYERLIDPEIQQKNKNYNRLAEILQSCISHNYLKVNYDAKQGKKGSEVTILYLNRLFCANFELPLGKGGWRHKTLDDLCEWLDLPSETTKKGGNKK